MLISNDRQQRRLQRRTSVILGFLLAVLLAGWLSWTASADSTQTATVGFTASSYSATSGEQLVVDLVVNDAQELGGWEVVLTYDPTFLGLVDMTPGGFLSSTGRTVAPLGPMELARPEEWMLGSYSYGSGSGASGQGILAQLRFDVLAAGQTNLALSEAVLARTSGIVVEEQAVITSGAAIDIGTTSQDILTFLASIWNSTVRARRP